MSWTAKFILSLSGHRYITKRWNYFTCYVSYELAMLCVCVRPSYLVT